MSTSFFHNLKSDKFYLKLLKTLINNSSFSSVSFSGFSYSTRVFAAITTHFDIFEQFRYQQEVICVDICSSVASYVLYAGSKFILN